HPRPRARAARQRDGRWATLEIVPFRAVQGGEKFGPVDPEYLAVHRAGPSDQSRITTEVEQPPADPGRADERGASGEDRMQRVPAHQRPVREQQRRVGAGRGADPRRPRRLAGAGRLAVTPRPRHSAYAAGGGGPGPPRTRL